MLSKIINDLDIETHLKGKTVLLVGASGFIGSEIGLHLARYGCTIRGIDNSAPNSDPVMPYPCQYTYWEHTKPIPIALGFDVDAIINVAGVSMPKAKWTVEHRNTIVESRVEITKRCVEFANFHNIPLMLQMSWTGYYGDTRGTWTNESFPPGTSITAGWCVAWENATSTLRKSTRLVIMRSSAVFSTRGGPVIDLVDEYALGFGASLRNHDYILSWIHIADFLSFISHAIADQSYRGVYNVCSPEPTDYSIAHQELKKYYPSGINLPVPIFVVRMAMGVQANLVLQSSRVVPKRLLDRGFVFRFASFDKALKDLLSYKINNLTVSYHQFFLPVPRKDAYKKLAKISNWVHLYPKNLGLSVTSASSPTVREGAEVGYSLRYLGVAMNWKEKVFNCDPGHAFQVVQLYGPFTVYEISRTFTEIGGGTLYDVRQRYQMPYGPILNYLANKTIKKTHEEVKTYQQQLFREWFGGKADGQLPSPSPRQEPKAS